MLPGIAIRTKLRHMLIARTLPDLRAASARLRRHADALAFVPTMGALHAGHRALVRAGIASGAATVASIFVNPLQFAPTEDLARYPRDEAGDLAVLEAEGCALAWLPDVATMYPVGEATTITVAGPAEQWEGDARPGHFRGVATVCAKLFGQVRPDRAYFGEKDWQQLQVVRRMTADLLLPLEIIGVETVRETDGLAMSSRNRFLSATERAVAPALIEALRTAAARLAAGEAAAGVLAMARAALGTRGFDVDYLALVDPATLMPLGNLVPGARLIAAAMLSHVRLLDNIRAI
ncbi:pantoate--beta-alanine ligase [Rhodopila sp.]|uniref:pantoate--beta-alanine ligase n=1 Tax=Rhodopila sp. TaxID=2480087 RepID=UPI003D0B1216